MMKSIVVSLQIRWAAADPLDSRLFWLFFELLSLLLLSPSRSPFIAKDEGADKSWKQQQNKQRVEHSNTKRLGALAFAYLFWLFKPHSGELVKLSTLLHSPHTKKIQSSLLVKALIKTKLTSSSLTVHTASPSRRTLSVEVQERFLVWAWRNIGPQ